MWQLVQANGQNADFNALNCVAPTARTRHATCINQDGCIYLYGGKSGNMSLKDLWRFDTENNHWTEIKCTGDQPPCLEEHIMIAFNVSVCAIIRRLFFGRPFASPNARPAQNRTLYLDCQH